MAAPPFAAERNTPNIGSDIYLDIFYQNVGDLRIKSV
jgi:hypothetical protein